MRQDPIRIEPFPPVRFGAGVTGPRVRVPVVPSGFPPGERYFVDVAGPDGAPHSVPLHRVRAVWRDGALVWQRPG